MDIDYYYRTGNCYSCIHLDQPPYRVGRSEVGGCREKVTKDGLPRKDYRCAQYFRDTSVSKEEY